MSAPAVDQRAGPSATAVRVALPFGGVGAWALHLAACYVAVEVLVRTEAAADQVAGLRADVFAVLVITLLAAVPTVVLIVVARRRLDHESDELVRFTRFFCTWLNVAMLFAIVLEGAVILVVAPR
jgi:hypothetical protein